LRSIFDLIAAASRTRPGHKPITEALLSPLALDAREIDRNKIGPDCGKVKPSHSLSRL